jgi:hypothetical protein
MPVGIDTNILLYSLNPGSRWHQAAVLFESPFRRSLHPSGWKKWRHVVGSVAVVGRQEKDTQRSFRNGPPFSH